MSFRSWNAWDVIFFDTDKMRTALPRRARFNRTMTSQTSFGAALEPAVTLYSGRATLLRKP
jgi:hypothetical protein